jgi:2-amino-4-hydroxy-6-hydroxymethyldihydropteridine diphosphokinase
VTEAVLSLGSNLGDRFAHLRGAVDGLAGVLRAVSPVYENPPWGVLDQPDFLNAVVLVDADGVDAWGWLRRAQALERAAGRRRTLRWGPRTLDVDVVMVDGVTSTDPELTLPHPGAHQRVTVLLPWHDIQPDADLPGHGPVAGLLAGLDRSMMHRRDDLVLAPALPPSEGAGDAGGRAR